MCLILKGNKKAKIASKDIECWKVLRVKITNSDEKTINGELYSPNQHYYYELNKLMVEKSHCKITKCNNVDTIESGVFHTFAKRKDAIEYARFFSGSLFTYLLIVKCIIPKGTRYYEGTFPIFSLGEKFAYGSKKLYVTDYAFGPYTHEE